WSLFSFNIGVEIGQLAVVVAVAVLLGMVRSRSESAGRRVAFAGSLVVIAAGAFWFVQPVVFPAMSTAPRSRSNSNRLICAASRFRSTVIACRVRRGRRFMKRRILLGGVVAVGALSMTLAGFQNPPAGAAQGRGEGRGRGPQGPPVAEIEKVRDNLYMITGGGGNTAAVITDGGVGLGGTTPAHCGP